MAGALRVEADELEAHTASRQPDFRTKLGLAIVKKEDGLKRTLAQWDAKGCGLSKADFRLAVRGTLGASSTEADSLFDEFDSGGAGFMEHKALAEVLEAVCEAAEAWRDAPEPKRSRIVALRAKADVCDEAAAAAADAEAADAEVETLRAQLDGQADVVLGSLFFRRRIKPGAVVHHWSTSRGAHVGELSRADFVTAVAALGKGLGSISPLDLERVFEAYDADGDGYLDAEEAKQMIRGLQRLAEDGEHQKWIATQKAQRLRAVATRKAASAHSPLVIDVSWERKSQSGGGMVNAEITGLRAGVARGRSPAKRSEGGCEAATVAEAEAEAEMAAAAAVAAAPGGDAKVSFAAGEMASNEADDAGVAVPTNPSAAPATAAYMRVTKGSMLKRAHEALFSADRRGSASRQRSREERLAAEMTMNAAMRRMQQLEISRAFRSWSAMAAEQRRRIGIGRAAANRLRPEEHSERRAVASAWAAWAALRDRSSTSPAAQWLAPAAHAPYPPQRLDENLRSTRATKAAPQPSPTPIMGAPVGLSERLFARPQSPILQAQTSFKQLHRAQSDAAEIRREPGPFEVVSDWLRESCILGAPLLWLSSRRGATPH